MILDSFKNVKYLEALHPLFKQAFDYILSTDFSTLKDGIYPIDGDNLVANIQHINCKEEQTATIEKHRKYIDIQFPLLGVEQIGWKPGHELMEESVPYDEEKDIAFYIDRPTAITRIYPGQFAVYFPEDGHAPGIGEGLIRKVVVKVKADYSNA